MVLNSNAPLSKIFSINFPFLHQRTDNVCRQTIDIGSEPGINVLSHEGIGCKLFPDVYPVSNCEVTFSGSGTLNVNATLVNFRETTCDGSELVVDTPSSDRTTNAVDVCTENAPTEFTPTAGKVKISFSAGAGQTGQNTDSSSVSRNKLVVWSRNSKETII
ncbi:hypothetical protein FHG87_024546 [Trinorchestia longiramus]|nr:hypothetical protein FHG87_024546 [Trinorchestia longiramus]